MAPGWKKSSSRKGMQMNQTRTTVISRIKICKGTRDLRSYNKGLPGMKDSRL